MWDYLHIVHHTLVHVGKPAAGYDLWGKSGLLRETNKPECGHKINSKPTLSENFIQPILWDLDSHETRLMLEFIKPKFLISINLENPSFSTSLFHMHSPRLCQLKGRKSEKHKDKH